jgi:hypothetical protein
MLGKFDVVIAGLLTIDRPEAPIRLYRIFI